MANFNFLQKVKNVYYGHRYLLGKVSQGLVHRPILLSSSSSKSKRVIILSRCFSSSSSSPPVAAQKISATISSSILHTSSPWLTLPPEFDTATGKKVDRFYCLTDKRIFKLHREKCLQVPEDARCFGSSRGWLAFIDPTDGSIYLTDPFNTRDEAFTHRLPSIPPLSNIYSEEKHLASSFESLVKHLTLSCDPVNGAGSRDCVAMVVYGGGRHSQQLACIRTEHEDQSWTALISGATTSYPQVVCPWNGVDIERRPSDVNVKLFYSMYFDLFGLGIDAWEILKRGQIPIRHANFMYQKHHTNLHEEFKFDSSERNIRNRCASRQYLVADDVSADLMLVVRHHTVPPRPRRVGEDKDDDNDSSTVVMRPKAPPYKTLRFDVYKVDMKKEKLKRLKSLGDRVFFLGSNQSFILSAGAYPGLIPNSIYFTDDSINNNYVCPPNDGHDLGIYNLGDNSIEPCYPFSDELKTSEKILPPLLWVAPGAFSC